MSGFIETSKVKSDNPDHQPDGYFIKNTADLTEDDVLFDTPPKGDPEDPAPDTDQFDDMDKDALKAHLTEQEIAFHHMSGEAKLRDLCREHAASEQV